MGPTVLRQNEMRWYRQAVPGQRKHSVYVSVVLILYRLSILQNTDQTIPLAGLLTAQLRGEPFMSSYRGELCSAQPVQQDIMVLDSGKFLLTGPAGSGPLLPLSHPLSSPDCELREDRDLVLPTLVPRAQPRTWSPTGQTPAAIY